MKKNQIAIAFLVILLIIVGLSIFLISRNSQDNSNSQAKQAQTKTEKKVFKAVVYKSPTCGCCKLYISYLKNQGFDIEVQEVNDNEMQAIKKKYQIAENKLSCHTTIVENYFFEGHIPVEAINKVLEEKLDTKGLALPGMPSGSPGMPGKKFGPFEIYQLSKDAKWSDYIDI